MIMTMSGLKKVLDQNHIQFKNMIQNGFDVNASINGMPYIMVAIQLKSDNGIKLLLENGANPNAMSNSGFTALACACSFSNLCAVSELLKHRADPNLLSFPTIKKHDDQQLLDNESALHYAVINGLSNISAYENQLQIVELLISSGADINHQNSRGNTALLDAFDFLEKTEHDLYLSHKNLIFTLVKAGANLEIKNYDNLSIFDVVRRDNFFDIINKIEVSRMRKELQNGLDKERIANSPSSTNKSRRRMDSL